MWTQPTRSQLSDPKGNKFESAVSVHARYSERAYRALAACPLPLKVAPTETVPRAFRAPKWKLE
jgi:hypothetical protein